LLLALSRSISQKEYECTSIRSCRRNERRNGDWKYGKLEKRGEEGHMYHSGEDMMHILLTCNETRK
jgi:hypothetical protein